VLDLSVSDLRELDVETRACPESSTPPLIFLTARLDVNAYAMRAAGLNVLLKPIESEALLTAVRDAHARDAESRASSDRLETLSALYGTLTARERQVFAGVVAGRLNKQIAADIGAAERTVKAYRARVLSKMRMRSAAELARAATELGLAQGGALGTIWNRFPPEFTARHASASMAARLRSTPPNNLPQQLTSFVGRDMEMAEVRELLRRTRLLTLTGAGGCGKSRLAIQVAKGLVDRYQDGVWLAEFASLSDSALVPQTIAGVFAIKHKAGRSVTEALIEYLASRHVLLVLDNSEHVLGACAEMVEATLLQCPHLVALVTSRERLGVMGELTYRVPSLSVPDAKRSATPEYVMEHEAARLFVERAALQKPHLEITRRNAAALASICRQLDGIPLAIELAAARARTLSVQELNEGLEDRFRLLTGGPRTALPRHQTLRSLIDWSYALLSDAERALLCRLSVFSGGCTLDAARQVCTGDAVDSDGVLDVLTALVDKSLVIGEERNDATRYLMLETVRHYARDRQSEQSDNAHWSDRHTAYFLKLAIEAEPHLTGAEQQFWFDRLDAEHDNLRAALAWSCAEGGDATAGLELAAAIWWFWEVRGYHGEGRGWFSKLLAATSEHRAQPARGKALNAAGGMARQQGDYAAARVLHEEALMVHRELGNTWGIAASLNNLSLVAYVQGDYSVARSLQEEALSIFRELGDPRGIPASLNNLGNIAFYEGNLGLARTYFEEALAIQRNVGDRRSIAGALGNLGNVNSSQGDHTSARAMLRESLAIFRGLGDPTGIARMLEGLGYVASALDGPRPAARLWGRAERLRAEMTAPLTPSDRRRYEHEVAAARAALHDDAAIDLAWREGRSMTLEEAMQHALRDP
jgi:non-specific serine/threonine protein kinase